MTQHRTRKYVLSTPPTEVRQYLGVDTNDAIAFEIMTKGDVRLTMLPYRIADLAGAAGTLLRPLAEREFKTIAAEARAEATAREG